MNSSMRAHLHSWTRWLRLVLACLAVFRERVARRAEPVAALVIGGVGAYLVIDRVWALVGG